MREPKTHPVFLKVYGRPSTPEPTMAMKTLAKVFPWDESLRGLARSGVSSLGKGGSVCEDELASLSNTTMVALCLWVANLKFLILMKKEKLGCWDFSF